jgi:hypothetical protein
MIRCPGDGYLTYLYHGELESVIKIDSQILVSSNHVYFEETPQRITWVANLSDFSKGARSS